MGLSFATVQRMFLGSFLAAALTWVLQDSMMDATWVFLGLSALTGIVWGLSEKDITFDALGMNASGFFVVFSFFVCWVTAKRN